MVALPCLPHTKTPSSVARVRIFMGVLPPFLQIPHTIIQYFWLQRTIIKMGEQCHKELLGTWQGWTRIKKIEFLWSTELCWKRFKFFPRKTLEYEMIEFFYFNPLTILSEKKKSHCLSMPFPVLRKSPLLHTTSPSWEYLKTIYKK